MYALYTIHYTPYTIHHTPYTIHHTPYTIHHTPYTIHHTPYTIHHTPYTIHHTPYTIQCQITLFRLRASCQLAAVCADPQREGRHHAGVGQLPGPAGPDAFSRQLPARTAASSHRRHPNAGRQDDPGECAARTTALNLFMPFFAVEPDYDNLVAVTMCTRLFEIKFRQI